ncbi:VPLPA-CTERM sorting domain-containing protein [Aquicoccus sp. SCR17]|nr:VPLPA-CTERM sorting domain-containing protein [Carideicomes alvinocaridis]
MNVVSGSLTETVDNFIEWEITGSGLGGKTYDVTASLYFSAPPPGGGGGATGDGWFATVGGLLSAGSLEWENGGVGTVFFDNGYRITYDLHDDFVVGLGNKAYTGVTFTAAVPVPAAGLLLVGALGGLGALRRRKKAA